jgi:SNF2 family DNA or RNA helicase
VIVDKLIIKGTVEDRILSLQHAKRAMVEQALGNKFAKSTDCRCVCATLF